MELEQLKKANEITSRVAILKKHVSLINETETTLIFKQYSRNNYELSIGQNDKSPLDDQLRVILQATKQTIKSIIEREIEKLEKEFKQI